MKKIYSFLMALCVALCASATPLQGISKKSYPLYQPEVVKAELAPSMHKAPAATQGLQYDAEAGELIRYYNETDQIAIDADYLAQGNLYIDIMAGDKSDYLTLLLFVEDTVEGAIIPEGTYPITSEPAYNTAPASQGYVDGKGVYPCAYYPLVEQAGQLYISTPMYFMQSGNIVVEHVNGAPKITINAVNSNNVPMTIVYEVGGESGIVNPKLQYDEQTGSVNRTYTTEDILDINTDYIAQYNLGVNITAADYSDQVSLLFFVPAADPEIGIPAGTYPIASTPAMNTILAAEGVNAQGQVAPSFYSTLVEQGGKFYLDKLYFMVSGQAVVEKINGKLKMTIDAVNSYDVPIHIVYDATSVETAIENVTVNNNASKLVENNQLLIIKDGVKYNVLGSVVE